MKTLTKLLAVVLVLVMCVGMFGSGAYALVDNNGLISSDLDNSDESDLVGTGDSGLVGAGSDDSSSSDEPALVGTGSSGLVDDDGLIGTEGASVVSSQDEGKKLEGTPKYVSLNGATAAFETVAEALDDTSAQAGTEAKTVTVKLVGNLTEAGIDIDAQTYMRTINLNLNGYTLDLVAGTISVGANNKLVISGSGTINGTSTLITAADDSITNIWGGTFTGSAATVIADTTGTGTGVVTLYGGTYKAIDIGLAAKRGSAVIADGCVVKKETISSVDYYTLTGAVASITSGGTTTPYATVAAAIAAATAGNTIVLQKNSAAEELAIDKNLIIDLNGHTLNLSKTMLVKEALTINDTSAGKVVGPAANSTLFDIKDTNYPASYLTIAGGKMTNYATLYTRESSGAATPVTLKQGSSYQVKPTNAADLESGYMVAGSSDPYYIVNSTKPTVKSGSVVYDYELYKRYLSEGEFVYDPQKPLDSSGKYTLTISSKNLTSVKVFAKAADGTFTVEKNTLAAAQIKTDTYTVEIKASDSIYSGLIAGLYMVRFTFAEGIVDVPLYVLPTITVKPAQKVMPDTAAAAVTFTFANAGEANNFTYSFAPQSAAKSDADVLVSGTDYSIDTTGTVLSLNYSYLNENSVKGNYYLYCNYDARVASRAALAISGTTEAAENPPVTPTTAPTTAPTASPTATTATISYNTANSTGNWYKGYSGSLKFNVTPANATVKVGGYTLVNGTDYSISNGVLTINNSYLNTLPYMHSDCVTYKQDCVNGGAYTIQVSSPDGSSATKTFQLKPYFGAVNGVVNHTYGGSNTLTFVSSDPIEQVYVGGTLLSTNYYTLSNYNRTLTLSSAFLNNQLTLAEYTLTVIVRSSVDNLQHKPEPLQFRNVTASYAASTTYAMGDNNNIYIWIAVLAICAVAVVALIPKKKKLPADAPNPEDKQE